VLSNAVIGAFLVLQVAAGFKLTCPPKVLPALEPLRVACAPELWPFLEYNMYNGARQAGEVHHAYDLIAETRDGGEQLLTHEAVGVSYYDLRGRAIKWLLADATAKTTLVLAEFLSQHPDIVALRIEAQPYRIEQDGSLTALPRTTLTHHAVRSGQILR
jgi:hypothetical protein